MVVFLQKFEPGQHELCKVAFFQSLEQLFDVGEVELFAADDLELDETVGSLSG